MGDGGERLKTKGYRLEAGGWRERGGIKTKIRIKMR